MVSDAMRTKVSTRWVIHRRGFRSLATELEITRAWPSTRGYSSPILSSPTPDRQSATTRTPAAFVTRPQGSSANRRSSAVLERVVAKAGSSPLVMPGRGGRREALATLVVGEQERVCCTVAAVRAPSSVERRKAALAGGHRHPHWRHLDQRGTGDGSTTASSLADLGQGASDHDQQGTAHDVIGSDEASHCRRRTRRLDQSETGGHRTPTRQGKLNERIPPNWRRCGRIRVGAPHRKPNCATASWRIEDALNATARRSKKALSPVAAAPCRKLAFLFFFGRVLMV